MKTLLICSLVLFVLISLAGIIKSFIPVIRLTFAGLNLKKLFRLALVLYFIISIVRNIFVSVF